MAKLEEEGYIAKLRGLPWSATVEDIQKFFRDCKILCGKMGIHMTTSREGRPSGEAFVEFEDADDLEIAVQKDREHIGNRYIEVFKVNKTEMDWVIKRSGPNAISNEDGCVRLRGLPFACSKEEIAQFFTGLEIVPNGITLLTDYSGRSSGEAYVQFVNREVAEKALLKHREKIGHRYIEIFRSSLSEIHNVLGYQGTRRSGGVNGGSYSSRPGPYDRDTSTNRYGSNRFQARASRSFKGANFSNNDYGEYDRSNWSNNARNGEITNNRNSFPNNSWGNNNRAASGLHCVHMRGLPFKATEADVADFFKPVVPINIHLLLDLTGRASGEADVEFASHDDAVRAMAKDKGHMEHRYIELFLNSSGGTSNGTTAESANHNGNCRRCRKLFGLLMAILPENTTPTYF